MGRMTRPDDDDGSTVHLPSARILRTRDHIPGDHAMQAARLSAWGARQSFARSSKRTLGVRGWNGASLTCETLTRSTSAYVTHHPSLGIAPSAVGCLNHVTGRVRVKPSWDLRHNCPSPADGTGPSSECRPFSERTKPSTKPAHRTTGCLECVRPAWPPACSGPRQRHTDNHPRREHIPFRQLQSPVSRRLLLP